MRSRGPLVRQIMYFFQQPPPVGIPVEPRPPPPVVAPQVQVPARPGQPVAKAPGALGKTPVNSHKGEGKEKLSNDLRAKSVADKKLTPGETQSPPTPPELLPPFCRGVKNAAVSCLFKLTMEKDVLMSLLACPDDVLLVMKHIEEEGAVDMEAMGLIQKMVEAQLEQQVPLQPLIPIFKSLAVKLAQGPTYCSSALARVLLLLPQEVLVPPPRPPLPSPPRTPSPPPLPTTQYLWDALGRPPCLDGVALKG